MDEEILSITETSRQLRPRLLGQTHILTSKNSSLSAMDFGHNLALIYHMKLTLILNHISW